ncbi:hypothetical protein SLG_15280 [Sphingobium sp. SYK-6]|nr:hypothetical protein SLG_15280 [Sphingobium sp. SYK-6]
MSGLIRMRTGGARGVPLTRLLAAFCLLTISAAGLAASDKAAPPPPTVAADTLDALARDVDRLESLRAVKDLQRRYAHYSQYGRWREVANLFARNGRIEWDDERIDGAAAIARWLEARHGPRGLAAGALNTEFHDMPLVNLSADGRTAEGRWAGLAFRGDGKGQARIEGGVYQNRYVREDGRWKIAALHYHPQYDGDYSTGWRNSGNADLPIIPYHFDPDSAGVPLPAASGPPPRSSASLADLSARVSNLNDEDAVRNLQNAYGYYLDRRMWDDVVDLFAANGAIEIAGEGRFAGGQGVRAALSRMGPPGLARGNLNDRPLFDLIVRVAPGGREARARGIELAQLGAEGGKAGWEINVVSSRFVKDGGLWKIRDIHIQPVMKADYATGWGGGALPGSTASPPVFLSDRDPATGPAIGRSPAAHALSLADIRRRYQRSLAYDGAENVSAAYGYYLDDFQWSKMSAIFAVEGNKQSPFAGYYMSRARIAGAADARYGAPPDMRARVVFHWRIQPVIHVSQDGRSALLRTRLIHLRTGKWSPELGQPNAVGFQAGMYPNDQLVLEDGIWRLWSLTIDEHYFTSPEWKGGWAAVKPTPPGSGAGGSPLLKTYPPDLPMTDLGIRAEGFRGGTGAALYWPDILPMWFHYRNPVSGRVPERYWPDCVPCERLPQARMTRHGYQMPETGPQADGVAVSAPQGR